MKSPRLLCGQLCRPPVLGGLGGVGALLIARLTPVGRWAPGIRPSPDGRWQEARRGTVTQVSAGQGCTKLEVPPTSPLSVGGSVRDGSLVLVPSAIHGGTLVPSRCCGWATRCLSEQMGFVTGFAVRGRLGVELRLASEALRFPGFLSSSLPPIRHRSPFRPPRVAGHGAPWKGAAGDGSLG